MQPTNPPRSAPLRARRRILNLRILAGAAVVAFLMLLCTLVWIIFSAPSAPDVANLQALETLIPAPTTTPASAGNPALDPYAPTPSPLPQPGGLEVGAFVQISGTEGQGLRIRSAPGLAGAQLFLGFDTEAYTILDGPRELDGYSWYQLAAINDQTRIGWAASNFLTIIPKP